VLKLLDSATLPAGMRELVRARFAERHESPQTATELYAAATKAAPSDLAMWRERIGHLMRSARAAEAVHVADEGLVALPGNATLQSLKAYAQAAPMPQTVSPISSR
jgi:hypothetical protein